jgi:hypothetical protein
MCPLRICSFKKLGIRVSSANEWAFLLNRERDVRVNYSEDCGETTEQAFDDEPNEAEYVRVRCCGAERGEYEECIAVRI